ncbi:MAG: DNA translocase FtsK 4TM domain-containing protein [Candidatus Paceibacterota bacterium]|jgi:S-DNA-T family DNA segregation ATPase FtsK/SpoIIIE
MARKKIKKSERDNVDEKTSSGFFSKVNEGLKHETKHGVLAVACILLALLLFLAKFGFGGIVFKGAYYYLYLLFGSGYLLFPLALAVLGYLFSKAMRPQMVTTSVFGSAILFLAALGLMDLRFRQPTHGYLSGGLIGQGLAVVLDKLFDPTVSMIILTAVAVVGILILLDTQISLDGKLFGRRLWGEEPESEDEDVDIEKPEQLKLAAQPEGTKPEARPETPIDNSNKKSRIIASAKTAEISEEEFSTAFRSRGAFVPPPLSLLEEDTGKPGVGDIKANSNIIKRTLLNFGINVEMDEISIGPSVTRYALKPAEGVKLSKIVALQNDLSLALAAHPLRIEAPIPGKSLVGIEIPNTTKTTVRLGSMLASDQFAGSSKPLLMAMGRTVSGAALFTDLAKSPHMLIAGATGSGKSVTIHALILSLLYRNSPEAMRFIMIDPKRVELTLYNKIPHLLTPVITDAKKSILSLRWAAKEMERRYEILESTGSRDIQSYHKNIFEPALEKNKKVDAELPDPMPYIVIVLDELADIMTAYPRELEAAIVRLAQMSRAVGIHLILSTQRPSTEVITGLIKANIPSRVALQVPSQIDSRTIIDMPGAEKLLGAGDMLYLGGDMSKPVRLQCSFVSEPETKKVVKYLIDQYEDMAPNEIHMSEPTSSGDMFTEKSVAGFDSESSGDDDELYESAREAVMQAGKASTSYLQRKLKVGYARAARLIDLLEERGVVGPGEGAKPREVYGASGSSFGLDKDTASADALISSPGQSTGGDNLSS